jgi:adenine-specific DNA-methyltransferase
LPAFTAIFLGLSHTWLADDGIAGWLIPSEFMDVNYGVPVKQYLLNQVELLRIHRFDPSDLQFGDALVSSAVVWFRKRRAEVGDQVAFTYGGTLAKPWHSRLVPAATLQGVDRGWCTNWSSRAPASASWSLSSALRVTLGALW